MRYPFRHDPFWSFVLGVLFALGILGLAIVAAGDRCGWLCLRIARRAAAWRAHDE